MSRISLAEAGEGKKIYYTAFHPSEDGAGAKGSAAFPALLQTAFVQLFKRSATVLTKPEHTPTDDIEYTFDTASMTGITEGWTPDVPSGTEDVYVISVTVAGEGTTYTITPTEWSDPVLWAASTFSPIVVNLDNDNVTVPADFDGSNPNLTDAVTVVSVFEGQVDVTNLWTITPTPSTGISGTLVDDTYTVTAFTVDNGYVDFTISRTGYTSQTIRFTVSKAKAGSDGESATVYSLKTAVAAIKRDSNGDYTPDSLVINAYSITGQAPRTDYSGRFKIYTSTDGGDTYSVAVYTSATNENTYSYLLPAGITHVKVELFLAGGTTTMVDNEIIPVVADGIGGITLNLTNDNVTVPSDSDGSNPVLTEAVTTVSVFEGGTEVTGSWTITPTEGTGVTGTWVSPTYTVGTLTEDSTYVDFVATRTGYADKTIRFTISKAKAGTDGTPATVYLVEPSVGAIKKDNTGTYVPTTITFNAYSITGAGDRQSYSGRFIISVSDGGVTYTDQYTSTIDESSYEYTIPADITHVRATLYQAGGTTTLVDREIVPIVADGSDGTNGINGISINLSNDSCGLPANSSGAVTSYTPGVTQVTIIEGGTDVTADWTITPVANLGVSSGTWNNTTKTYTITGFNSGYTSGSVSFTATRSGYANLVATFAVTKINYGADGADALYRFLQLSSGVAKKNSGGTFDPTTIILSGKEVNGTSISSYAGRFRVWVSTNNGSTYANIYTSASDTTSYTWTITPTYSGADVTHIKLQLYEAGGTSTLYDEEIVPVVLDGTDGVDGSNGTNGTRTGMLTVYKWVDGDASTPTPYPSGTSTYYWSDGSYTAPSTANGWSITPGSASNDTQRLWACVKQFTDSTTNATSSVSWTGYYYYRLGGERGSRHFYISNGVDTSWNNTNVNNYIQFTLGLTKIIGDIATYYNTNDGYSETRTWDGSAWIVLTEVIDGNLLVDGTIVASKLAVAELITDNAQIGNLVVGTSNIIGDAITGIASGQDSTTRTLTSTSYTTFGTAVNISGLNTGVDSTGFRAFADYDVRATINITSGTVAGTLYGLEIKPQYSHNNSTWFDMSYTTIGTYQTSVVTNGDAIYVIVNLKTSGFMSFLSNQSNLYVRLQAKRVGSLGTVSFVDASHKVLIQKK